MTRSSNRLIKALLEDSIVRRLVPGIQLTDEPKLSDWHCVAAVDEPSPEQASGGGYGLNDSTARIKAVGEAVERLCCGIVPGHGLRRTSYQDLNGAVDPARFINFGDEVFSGGGAGYPARFVNFGDEALGGEREGYLARIREAPLSWVAGTRARSGERVWLPAQLVYTTWDTSDEPLLRASISTGGAFETSPEMAIRRGLFEIVERDSFMLWWLSGQPPPKLSLSPKRVVELIRYYERYLLEVDLLDITSDLDVPCVMAVLRDRTGVGPAVSCGLKAAPGYAEAALGATIEAYQSRKYTRCLYLETGGPTPLGPQEITGIESRALFWYPEEMLERIEPFLAGETARPQGRSRGGPQQGSRRRLGDGDLEKHLLQRGFDVYHVDLSPDRLRRHGCYVYKTVIPEMHPLFMAEDLRHDSSERLAGFYGGPPNALPHPCL